MATGFSKTTFNNLGTAPAIDATFLNTLQDFLVAIANGGAGSVVKADNANAVSAAGIGGTWIPAMASTADSYKTGGIFYCSSAITNAPFYGVKNANILVAPKDASNVTQFAMSVNGSRAIKLRQYTGGAWSAWSEVGGGGSGAVNFLQNKLSENDLSYITNTGCTVTWDTAEDLSVAGSLKIVVSSSGTGRQVEIDLSELSDAQITELCRLSFFYKLTVGADDNVGVYILNGSNKFYFGIPFLAANSGTLTKYDSDGMVTNRTGNTLVFAFKDNSAATVYLGDALLTPRVLPQGAVISEWQSYTPTTQGFGTLASSNCRWRRIGSSIEVTGKIAVGTSTSSEAQIGLPGSLVIKSDLSDVRVVGVGGRSTWVREETFLILATAGDTYFNVGVSSSVASAVLTPVGGTSVCSTGYFSFTAIVPVEGWASSINLVTDAREYASNNSTWGNDDLTGASSVYGPGGSALGTTNLAIDQQVKRVLFKNDINADDLIQLEIKNATGAWVPMIGYGGIRTQSIQTNMNYSGSVSAGAGLLAVTGNSKAIDVIFGRGPCVTIGGTIGTWANVGGPNWRVAKISHGNMAEAPASGIYESGSNANGYYVKYVDGTMVQWGSLTITALPTTLNLPVAFADALYQIIGAHTTAGNITNIATKTTTTAQVSCATHAGTNVTTGTVEWHAIGKWNLSRSVAAPGTPVGANVVHAKCSASSITPTSGARVQLNTIIEDALSTITTGASWKFTCPASGIYLLTCWVDDANGLENGRGILYKNGVTTSMALLYRYGGMFQTTQVYQIRLAVGDELYFQFDASDDAVDYIEVAFTRLSA